MLSQPRLAAIVAGVVLCLQAASAAPPPAIIAGLASDSFKQRESAQAALLEWGMRQPEAAKDWLFQRSSQEPDPEIRRRCLAVLRELVLGDYLKQGKGYVGILMQGVPVQVPAMPEARFGIRVTLVVPDSPAAKAGLQPGAVIVGVDDQLWHEAAPEAAFSQWIQARQPGSEITLRLLDAGRVIDRPLTLGRRPENVEQPLWPGEPLDLERKDRESRELYFKRWLEQRNAKR
jgi:hypothetical protein